MRLLGYGDRGILAEFDTLQETMAGYAAMRTSEPAGVVELVPAARTVLVVIDPRKLSLTATRHWLSTLAIDPNDTVAEQPSGTVVIPVRYDGVDLDQAAALAGLSTEALVELHTATTWRCAFIGFAPGFAYLSGDGVDLAMPRRKTSRPTVRRGSVALAGEFTGIYPRDSAGGWQIIGTTDAELWSLDRDPPALIEPGSAVRFERAPVGAGGEVRG